MPQAPPFDESAGLKHRFLANIGHEIRTPMNCTVAMTGLLLETPLSAIQKRYIEKIKASGESLLDVVNDLFDYSGIESGKLVMENTNFSMRDLIYGSIDASMPAAKEKGLEFRMFLDPQLPSHLIGDGCRVQQIIDKLLANAVKFTDEGSVELSVRVLEKTETDVSLQIKVADTGIGIAEKDFHRIFDSFSQVDSSSTRRFGGAGLGLAITRSLAERMGGTLSVESRLDSGSMFTVLLAFKTAPETSPVSLDGARGKQCRDVRVLIVEDHFINTEVLAELLRQSGIDVSSAANGLEALETIRLRDFDLVLMDIQMPHMDGLEATKSIRKLEKPGIWHLPIIAISGGTDFDEREKSLAAGMNDHLKKPVDVDELRTMLKKWLPIEKIGRSECFHPETIRKTAASDDFSAVSNLDVEAGLRLLAGNRELYLKLLLDFVKDFGEMPELLMSELRASHRDNAIRLVHAVKGISGNIGAGAMQAAGEAFEKVLLQSDGSLPFSLGPPLRTFIDRHDALMISIGAILAREQSVPKKKPACPAGDESKLEPLLLALKAALVNEEPRGCNGILQLLTQSAWTGISETTLSELVRSVGRYRFLDALALLERKN